MRKLAVLVALLALVSLGLPVQGGPPAEGASGSGPLNHLLVSPDEARTVATNWIALILHYEGKWGDSATAQVAEVREFKRGDRLLGYFCRVEPRGYVIVPLRKELGAVKAYSDTTILSPDSEEGLADLLKGSIERVVGWVEELAGPIETASPDVLDSVLEINYLPEWDELAVDSSALAQWLQADADRRNYTGGDPPLLTSSWTQELPYNCQCPGSDGACLDMPCPAGCVAIAGAQVLRYWAWPPDEYDWPNMPDRLPASVSCSDAQAEAVAELVHDVGVKAGMDYCYDGRCESDAYFANHSGKDLLDAFEDHFGYSSDADTRKRSDYHSAVDWFEEIKGQLNVNRPLPYAIPHHAVVCDGWKEVGSLPYRFYHINYGWGDDGSCQDGCNTWYLLDNIYRGDPGDEEMIADLYPFRSLKGEVSGVYRPEVELLPGVFIPYPYRYFDQNCWGDDAWFEAGHLLQFLPGVKVECTRATIAFIGWSDSNTRLYTVASSHQGVRIHSGHIYLYKDGGIRVY